MLEIVSVPAITAVVLFVMSIYKKYIANGKEVLVAIIPIIAALLGVGLSVIMYLANPSFIPADNIWIAILIGATSGLSATGCNQIVKQMSNVKNKKSSEDNKND